MNWLQYQLQAVKNYFAGRASRNDPQYNQMGLIHDFIGPPTRKKWRATVIVGASIFLLLLVFRYLQAGKNWSRFLSWDNDVGNTALSLVIGAVGSLIASFIFGRLHENEDTKLDTMRRLTETSFLNEFLSDLRHFGGRICSDYDVNISFSIIPNREDLLLVNLQYSYKKRIVNRKMTFTITSLRSDTSPKDLPDHDDEFFLHECYFNLDERDIKNVPSADLYSIKNLVIGRDHKLELKQTVGDRGRTRVEYEGTLPKEIPPNELVHIAFEVTFPMEIESQFSINFELPTKAAVIILDYSQFSDTIQVVSQSFISPRFGPNVIDRSDKNSKIHIVYPRWLLPKNGIVFCWWRKTKT